LGAEANPPEVPGNEAPGWEPPPKLGRLPVEAIIEILNGFAAPPVICGLSPPPSMPDPPLVDPPKPVGCALKPPKPVCWLFRVPGADNGEVMPVTPGVFGSEPGIGGKDSNNEAPKEEVGLNAFMPVNPVVCGFNVGESDTDGAPEDMLVAPVG